MKMRALSVGLTAAALGIGFAVLVTSSGSDTYVLAALATLILVIMVYTRPCLAPVCVVWAWVLSPELERFYDFVAGYHSINPFALVPYAVSIVVVVRLGWGLSQNRHAPKYYLWFSLACTWALLIGALYHALPALYEYAQYIVPLATALVLTLQSRRDVGLQWNAIAEQVRRAVTVAAGYALVQYLFLPRWDATWIASAGVGSIGFAVARHFRVFGTLNSPGVLGFALIVAVLLEVDRLARGFRYSGLLALVLQLTALALTLDRTAWLSLIIGVVAYALLTKRLSATLKVATVVAVAVALLGSLAPVAQVSVVARFGTFGNISQDASIRGRLAETRQYLEALSFRPLGMGLGSTGTSTKLDATHLGQLTNYGSVDSGVFDVALSFGWFAGACVLWCVVLAVRGVWRRDASNVAVGAAIRVALLAAFLSGNDLLAFSGFLFWLCDLAAIEVQTSRSRVIGAPHSEG